MAGTYLFYLDESGQREEYPPEGYFVLGAVGIPLKEWRSVNREITDLKWCYFDDPNVEMKSTWIRNPRERKKRYSERFGVSDEDLTAFMNAIYDTISTYNLLIMAAVIDKRRFLDRRKSGETPLSLAYTILFERIERCMQKIDGHAVLIFDKITDAEVKRVGYEKLLSQQHEDHREEGTQFVRVRRIVENLLFIPSSDNNGIQLADLCAYNVMRQFRDHGDHFHDHKGFRTDERYEYFARIEQKFYRAIPEGRYAQHALRRFPTKRAADWEGYEGRLGVLANDTEGHRTEGGPPA